MDNTLIKRGQRFQGFTEEGERILQWAQVLANNWEALKQNARQAQQALTGTLLIGAIPTTLAVTPALTRPIQTKRPNISVNLVTLCTEELIRRLDRYELDLGLTYLDDPLQGFNIQALYREHQVLLALNPKQSQRKSGLTWTEVAELPLCLLTQNMQIRRLINGAFREACVKPKVVLDVRPAALPSQHAMLPLIPAAF